MKKRRRLLALVLALALCAGCHDTSQEGQTETNDLGGTGETGETAATVPGQKTAIALAYSPSDSLNPFQVTTEYNYYLIPLVYEGLFRINDQFQAENLLCESYSNEGNQWEFQIKQGVLFHDGQELTARDVVYSIQQAQSSTCFAVRSQNIASCTASGRYTLRIRLNSADSRLPLLLTMPIVQRNTGAEDHPPGTGRYVVEDVDGTVTLRANESWHGGRVPITEIRLSALYQDSELSYVVGSGVIDAVCFEKPFATTSPIRGTFDVSTFPTTDLHYLGVNKNNRYLQDPLVRQAISAALDRELLVQKAFSGYADATLLPVNPVFADYGITAGDPDALLRQAGCTDTDGDGIYNYTDGTNIVLNLLVPQEDEMKQQAASIVAQSLLGSGIQVQVQALPAEQFQQEVAADRFDLFYGETRMDDAFDLSEMVFSGGSLCYGGGDEQVAQAMTNVKNAAQDQVDAAREQLYQVFSQQMPIIPMAYGRGCVVTGKDVMNPVQAASRDPYYNIHEWAS